MTHTTFIRDGIADADEKAVSNLATAFITPASGGVVDTNDYKVAQHSTPNASVDIAVGRAYVPNSALTMFYATYLNALANLAIGANASGNPRIDAIVLYIDLAVSPNATGTNVAKFYDVQGTPAGSPVAPNGAAILAAINNNPYIVLAHVAVANGFTTIGNGDITDERATASLGSGGGSGNEAFQSAFLNFVQSGLNGSVVSGLSGSINTGTFFFNGVQIDAASDGGHTYTANKDTYVDIDNTGTYFYLPVNNDATAPDITADSIRIAKFVTNGTDITDIVQDGLLDTATVPNFVYPTNPVYDDHSNNTIDAGGQSTSSASYVDMTGVETEVDIANSKALLSFRGSVQVDTIDTIVQIGYNIDGGSDFDLLYIDVPVTDHRVNISCSTMVTGISRGRHTFQMRWLSDGGESTLDNTVGVELSVIELEL